MKGVLDAVSNLARLPNMVERPSPIFNRIAEEKTLPKTFDGPQFDPYSDDATGVPPIIKYEGKFRRKKQAWAIPILCLVKRKVLITDPAVPCTLTINSPGSKLNGVSSSPP